MKIILLITGIILNLMSSNFYGLNSSDCNYGNPDCNCRQSCIKKIDEIDDRDFRLFVKEVKRVGSDIVILVQFRSKNSDFDIDLGRSSIVLTDRRGRKRTLDGCEISNFHIYSGEAKIFPFVFSGMVYRMKQPYRFTLDLYNIGTIVFNGLRLGMKSVEY